MEVALDQSNWERVLVVYGDGAVYRASIVTRCVPCCHMYRQRDDVSMITFYWYAHCVMDGSIIDY